MAKPWLARAGVLIVLVLAVAVIVGIVVIYLDLLQIGQDWVELHDGPVTD
jgi:hypothetical protein